MRLVTGDAECGEPEDGWTSGPTLSDTVNITITLCQFTGDQPEAGACPHRAARHHVDVDCLGVYVLAQRVLDMGVRDQTALLIDPPGNLTRPSIWSGTSEA